MNNVQISKTLIPALLLGLLLPATSFAEDEQPQEGKRKGPPKNRPNREQILEKFDADGDGALSEAERSAAKAAGKARRQAALKQYDVDGDGELNEEERQALRDAKREARKARLLEKFDADGDGNLSEEERATAKASMPNRKGGPKKGGADE